MTFPRRRFRPELTPLEDRVVPSVTTINETETNNTPAQADNIGPALTDGMVIVNGSISSVGDVDYYKFTVAANQRLWAYVDTGVATPSNDAVLTLLDTDGTSVIEMDDDDGTSLAVDGSVVSGLAPIIAGRGFGLSGAGTCYLKVQEYNNDAVLSPYKLHVRLTTQPLLSILVAETEPNNTRLSPDAISASEGAPLRTGEITSGDVDIYSFYARAGDRVFVAADGDPGRAASTLNLQLELVRGLFIPETLVTVNSSPGSTAADPAAEGFSYLIPDTGTYYVSVTGLGGTTGSYHLLVDGNSQPGTLQFGETSYVGSEAGGSVAVTVTRSGGADGEVAVDYAVSGGSASAGSDYTLAGGTLTFADGQTSKTLVIPLHRDPHVEGTETISLTLSGPTNGAKLGSRTMTTVFIRDSTVPPRPPLPSIMAVAGRRKGKSRVWVFDAVTGAMRSMLTPFRGYAGRLRLELRDVNGDGAADLIVRQGGRSKKQKVYDAVTLAPLPAVLA